MKQPFYLLCLLLTIILPACNASKNTDLKNDVHFGTDTIKYNANKKLLAPNPFIIKNTNSTLDVNPTLGKELFQKLSIEGALPYILDLPDTAAFSAQVPLTIIGDINDDALMDLILPFEVQYGAKYKEWYYAICLNNGESIEVREYFFRGSSDSEYIINFLAIGSNGIVTGKHSINTHNNYIASQTKKGKNMDEYPLAYHWMTYELVSL